MRNIQKIIKIGALTSKPYAFKSRSWELKYLESIDLNDTLGSNIKINYKNSQILRILPNINENINEEWITDKVRFSYDSINRWRFNIPLIKKEKKFINSSWSEVFNQIKNEINNNNPINTNIYGGYYNSIETLIAIKEFSYNIKNVKLLLNPFKNQINNDLANDSLLNLNDINIDNKKVFIFIGTNLRLENPILNLKFRKLSKKKNILIGYIGSSFNSTTYMFHIGSNTYDIISLLKGKNPFCSLIKKFHININNKKRNLTFILGLDYQNRFDSNNIETILNKFKSLSSFKFINIIFLREYLSEINSDLINFESNKLNVFENTKQINYLIGTENLPYLNKGCNFNIFIGHHNDKIRNHLNIILPSYTFFESSNLYCNILGILQETKALTTLFKHTREDFLIIAMLNKYIYNKTDISLSKKIIRRSLFNIINNKAFNKCEKKFTFIKYFKFKYLSSKIYFSSFKNNKVNFYLNDSFTRASKNMKKCSKSFFFNKNSYIWN